jgi:hypothetical protein
MDCFDSLAMTETNASDYAGTDSKTYEDAGA